MYNLDPAAARAANEGGGKFIREAGKYIGTFTKAENVTSKKGTKGIEFTFSTGAQTCDYLTLWTIGADGSQLHGMKVLNAILACLKTRTIAPREGTIQRWNPVTKDNEKVSASIFPDLMNKKIGLVLQGEEYRNGRGEIKTKLNIFAPFEAATELTADEVLDNKVQPQRLREIVEYVSHNPVRKMKVEAQPGGSYFADFAAQQLQQSSAVPQGGGDFYDSEIPF